MASAGVNVSFSFHSRRLNAATFDLHRLIIQVLRYSALGSGVLYGFYHQSSIYSRDAQHKKDAELAHEKSLIDKAKAEWAKKTAPKVIQSPGGVMLFTSRKANIV